MRSTLWWLGLIFGTLSVVMLIQQGWELGLSAPLQTALDWYSGSVQFVAGYLEPPIAELLGLLGTWLDLDLRLKAYWAHILLIFTLVVAPFFQGLWASVLPTDAQGPGDRVFLWMAAVAGGLYGSIDSEVVKETVDPRVTQQAIVLVLMFAFAVSLVALLVVSSIHSLVATVGGTAGGMGFRAYLIRTPAYKAADALVGLVIGVVTFVATNAGLKLAGL